MDTNTNDLGNSSGSTCTQWSALGPTCIPFSLVDIWPCARKYMRSDPRRPIIEIHQLMKYKPTQYPYGRHGFCSHFASLHESVQSTKTQQF